VNVLKLALAVEKWSAGHAPVSVFASKCLNARDKSSACALCVQTCPTEAITLQDGVQLQADACIQCGLCLRQCPTGVFEGDDGAYKLLRCVSQIVDHEIVEIACKHHPAPTTGNHKADAVVTTNGCLSMLSPAAYLALFGLGVKKAVVRLDACADCPLGALCPQIEEALVAASQLLDDKTALVIETAPPERKAKSRPLYSVNNPPVSRRGLFRMMALQGASSADDLLAEFAPQEDGESPVPQERRRLLAALRHTLPAETHVSLPEQEFTRLRVSEACTACGLCARVCPTEALWFEESEDLFALTFSSAECINCGLCISLCEAKAVQRDGAPSAIEVLEGQVDTLHTGRLKRCRKCNVPFRGEGVYCPTCAFRKKNPFGFVTNPREHLAGSR
jgi:ferredoxin